MQIEFYTFIKSVTEEKQKSLINTPINLSILRGC